MAVLLVEKKTFSYYQVEKMIFNIGPNLFWPYSYQLTKLEYREKNETITSKIFSIFKKSEVAL